MTKLILKKEKRKNYVIDWDNYVRTERREKISLSVLPPLTVTLLCLGKKQRPFRLKWKISKNGLIIFLRGARALFKFFHFAEFVASFLRKIRKFCRLFSSILFIIFFNKKIVFFFYGNSNFHFLWWLWFFSISKNSIRAFSR